MLQKIVKYEGNERMEMEQMKENSKVHSEISCNYV